MCIVLDHANAVLIGSASFRDEVVDRLGTDPARFTIVPGGVDVERFTPADARSRQGDVTFIYHGRVDRRKGVLDLLDAVEDLPGARVVISGIGPDLDTAVERARGMAHVRFTGYAGYDQAPAILRQGDVFVSPTYAEGFSNTILEAMATGLATVSTHSVGVVDCLRDQINALLVTPGDIAGLRAALVRLRDDEPLRKRLAGTALTEVRERYTWGRVATQVAAVYRQIAGRPTAGDWTMPDGNESCRFRMAPHLL